MIVEFRNVGYSVGERHILQDIDLAIAPGETMVLLGRSGSGKTTLLRMLLGLTIPSRGEIRFEGKALSEWDIVRLRRRIGYVIQEAGLFPHRTVAENVGLVPRLEGWPPERVRRRTEELLEIIGLPYSEFAGRRPRELSGGQRQRVGVARALAADPPMLLLDEPFGALDPVTRLELQREFVRLRNAFGKTAIFVTHDVREALAVGARIVLLRDGRIEFAGTPQEFRHARHPEAQAFLACLTQN